MLVEELKKTKEKVDSIINQSLTEGLDNFKKETVYQINTGGKRVRPFLTLNFYKGLGGKNEKEALNLAAAIEIFHNYSLLLDDIIDRGELRRGKETSWRKQGSVLTMCISSLYFSTIIDLLGESDSKLNTFFSHQTKKVMEGELMDILQERGNASKESFYIKNKYQKITFENYKEMINKKTAALFELACGGGAHLAGKSIEKAKKLGHEIGLAYQIRDDILDIFGDESSFGKEIGKDIEERKGGNIILLFTQEEDNNLNNILSKEKIVKKDIKKAMNIIDNTDARLKANQLLDEHISHAINLLDDFSGNRNFNFIKKLINYLQVRNI